MSMKINRTIQGQWVGVSAYSMFVRARAPSWNLEGYLHNENCIYTNVRPTTFLHSSNQIWGSRVSASMRSKDTPDKARFWTLGHWEPDNVPGISERTGRERHIYLAKLLGLNQCSVDGLLQCSVKSESNIIVLLIWGSRGARWSGILAASSMSKDTLLKFIAISYFQNVPKIPNPFIAYLYPTLTAYCQDKTMQRTTNWISCLLLPSKAPQQVCK